MDRWAATRSEAESGLLCTSATGGAGLERHIIQLYRAIEDDFTV
jgi:hypothetical protein